MAGIGVPGLGHDLLAKKGKQPGALITQGIVDLGIHGRLACSLLLGRIDIGRQRGNEPLLILGKQLLDVPKSLRLRGY